MGVTVDLNIISMAYGSAGLESSLKLRTSYKLMRYVCIWKDLKRRFRPLFSQVVGSYKAPVKPQQHQTRFGLQVVQDTTCSSTYSYSLRNSHG